MVAAVLDALFLPVLVGVLVGYRAGRDPVQRDVLLVFVAMTVFFVRNLIRQLGGTLPALVDDLATTLLLAQPGLTLRLAGRLRPLPRWLWPSALAAYLAAVAVTFAVGTPPPLPAVLVRVGCLTATGLAAPVLVGDGGLHGQPAPAAGTGHRPAGRGVAPLRADGAGRLRCRRRGRPAPGARRRGGRDGVRRAAGPARHRSPGHRPGPAAVGRPDGPHRRRGPAAARGPVRGPDWSPVRPGGRPTLAARRARRAAAGQPLPRAVHPRRRPAGGRAGRAVRHRGRTRRHAGRAGTADRRAGR